METWIASSLVRHYPGSRPRQRKCLSLHIARGETCSFQVGFRTGEAQAKVRASAVVAKPVVAQVRSVGWVPQVHRCPETPREELDGHSHVPGLVPDPLLPDACIHAGSHETHAFWITVRVPAETESGPCPVTVTIHTDEGEESVLTAVLTVHRGVVAPRRDFPVTHWFYADALCDWYGTEVFREEFWHLLDPYLADLADHGQDTILVPVFTPPTDGVKRPTQLLRIDRDGNRLTFDWTLVRRWIKAAQAQGLRYFEWPHFFTQWGAEFAVRVYEGHGQEAKLLWPAETAGASPVYRSFLAQFLPELEGVLRAEGVLERSFFHVSDEPHGDEHLENYRAARAVLQELAPWMKVMDAISDVRFAREGLTDIPVPNINVAPSFIQEGFPAWTYFCCGPTGRFLSRVLDTPLPKIRMAGWLFYKTRVRGFLHWSANYWYKAQTPQLIDPYQVTDGLKWPIWPCGDTVMVYPGEYGPVDSLRWETFAESLQDYALLQSAGIDPADPLLADLEDYRTFPRTEAWIRERRRRVLRKLDESA